MVRLFVVEEVIEFLLLLVRMLIHTMETWICFCVNSQGIKKTEFYRLEPVDAAVGDVVVAAHDGALAPQNSHHDSGATLPNLAAKEAQEGKMVEEVRKIVTGPVRMESLGNFCSKFTKIINQPWPKFVMLANGMRGICGGGGGGTYDGGGNGA